MRLCQRDLLIRDTVNSAVNSSVLGIESPLTSTEVLTVIRHPWIKRQKSFQGAGGVRLVRSDDNRVIVSQSTAAAAIGLPTSSRSAIADARIGESNSVQREQLLRLPVDEDDE